VINSELAMLFNTCSLTASGHTEVQFRQDGDGVMGQLKKCRNQK